MSQAEQIVSELDALYGASVERLRIALDRFIRTGERPDPADRRNGAFAYPEIRLRYRGHDDNPVPPRSFGRLVTPGDYAISVTRPALFADYLTEQLALLIEDYDVEVTAAEGRQEIPFPYVIEAGHDLMLDDISATELSRWFPATELAFIGDEIADGTYRDLPDAARPLALFDGLRTDFSLARLRHYTGTPPEHVQRFILFTNYHRYIDEFVRWACGQLGEGSRFTALSGAGGVMVTPETADPERVVADSAWRRHQMPAYHLMAPNRSGISVVNIGVGPSNAKTITDHLAVVRPEAWLMIGHCGGLRPSQRIGDYVLAHAYLRDDHVPGRRAAARNPGARDRRGAARPRRRGRDDFGRECGHASAAAAHRHDRHHRRPQLGAALFQIGAALLPIPRGGHRHGIGDDRCAGLPVSAYPTGRCSAFPTSRSTAN